MEPSDASVLFLSRGRCWTSTPGTLRTSSGTVIEVRSVGVRSGARDALAALSVGDLPPAEDYYFRTHVLLRTADPRLAYLNDRIAVSTGERLPDGVRLRVFLLG